MTLNICKPVSCLKDNLNLLIVNYKKNSYVSQTLTVRWKILNKPNDFVLNLNQLKWGLSPSSLKNEVTGSLDYKEDNYFVSFTSPAFKSNVYFMIEARVDKIYLATPIYMTAISTGTPSDSTVRIKPPSTKYTLVSREIVY